MTSGEVGGRLDGLTDAGADWSELRVLVTGLGPVGLAVGMLATGVLLGLGTRWRLTEWTWVLTKLVIGLVLTTLVFVALLPGALRPPRVRGAATKSANVLPDGVVRWCSGGAAKSSSPSSSSSARYAGARAR